jgi:hypothetical protein
MLEADQERRAEMEQAREAARRRILELIETDPVLAYAQRRLAGGRARDDVLAEARRILEGDDDPPPAGAPRGRHVGQRLADAFHTAFATWWFVIAQSIFIVVWMLINIIAWAHFDGYPFLFLNLAFSLWAAYAAPLILMADARAADREHRRIDEQSRQMALILRTLERYAPPGGAPSVGDTTDRA